MIKNEIIKLFTNKFLLSVLVVIVLAQIGLVFWTQYSDKDSRAYNEIVTDIKELPQDEVVGYLEDKIEYLEHVHIVMNYVIADMPLEQLEIENVESVLQSYESGDYLKYTDNVMDELNLYKEIYEEFKEVYFYNTTVNTIIDNTERFIKSSRTDKNSFDYFRALRTRQKYQNLTDLSPDYVSSRGINSYLEYVMTDYFIMAFMMFATVVIITMEKENGLTILSKTTVNGGIKHGLVKSFTLAISCVVVTVLMNLVTMVVVNGFYPFCDMNAPIQSVCGYGYCSLNVCIWQFIVINILMKILFYFAVTGVFYFLCCCFRNCIPVYCISVIITAGLTVLSNTISPTSYLSWINNYNLLAHRNTIDVIKRYVCVNIGGRAVDKVTFVIILFIVVSVVCVAVGVVIYTHMEEREKKSSLKLNLINRRKIHTNMFLHELHKVLWAQKGILILLIATVMGYVSYSPVKDTNYSLADVVYEYQAERIQGKYSSKTAEFISDFKTITEKKYDEEYGSATYTEKLVINAEKTASERLVHYGHYLSEKEASYLINNDGYVCLTYGNHEVNRHNAIKMLIISVMAVLTFVSIMSVDYQYGEDVLVHTTLFGGKKFRLYKVLIGILMAVVLFVIFWLPELISTLKGFGTEYINVPAYSLAHLDNVPKWISIGQYIGIGYVVRFLLICGIMGISYLINIKLRSTALSMIAVLMICIIPIVLYLVF